MKPIVLSNSFISNASLKLAYFKYFLVFCAGLLGPLGFAPFHLPGLTILGLAILFNELTKANAKQSAILGFIYGLGNFGLGVSWVILSIHDYGHIDYFSSSIITLLFIFYLSLFPALVGVLFKKLTSDKITIYSMLLFSCLWCGAEFLRAQALTGFPWLLIGVTQMDTPLKYLAPIIGIYGLSLLCVFSATLLTMMFRAQASKRAVYLIGFVLLLISPSVLESIHWTNIKNQAISIGAVQANLSMRDKWDETLFWNLLSHYEKTTNSLLGKQLIILPESAIPLPASYLENYLDKLNQKALSANSALMIGIMQSTNNTESNYYNAIITLGKAKGHYIKRHLVPFGEYIPRPFVAINRWLNLPEPNVLPGKVMQKLINIVNYPIASLICYEIAYPSLLRMQMPKSQWIVSISDNGWFGHSLASYQQLQMAQMLSLLTGRYQIMVNNDGLSSVINAKGDC